MGGLASELGRQRTIQYPRQPEVSLLAVGGRDVGVSANRQGGPGRSTNNLSIRASARLLKAVKIALIEFPNATSNRSINDNGLDNRHTLLRSPRSIPATRRLKAVEWPATGLSHGWLGKRAGGAGERFNIPDNQRCRCLPLAGEMQESVPTVKVDQGAQPIICRSELPLDCLKQSRLL
jgi:hypothetical protein